MKNFEASYKALNKEQQKAVDHIDGPLLVLAGPGTGKTQLLSLRAAQILRKTDTDASGILCLTYTNKAAINMKERLLDLIGPEANAITVSTFHSFASSIIDSYPEYFWNGASLTPIPDSRQLEIVEDLLTSLPLDNPLAMRFAGKFTQVKPVIDAIGLSKEAGLTPDKLRSMLLLNIAYISEIEEELVEILETRLTEKQFPDVIAKIDALKTMDVTETIAPLKALDVVLKESFHHAINEKLAGKKNAVSAWKQKWVQNVGGKKTMHQERKYNSWWLNFCDVYEDYQIKSQQMGYMDISDIIIEAIRAIETYPELKADVQERYSYVMIDEFQDTNLAQGRLSHLIAEHHASEGKPNIMAVGDDDQTIYRFQGAELNNMREFVNLYGADIIVLTNNYRSTQSVLDTSKEIIEKSGSRLISLMDGLSKDLVSVNGGSGDIKYITYQTNYQQYSSIAELVKEYSSQGSVAILARNNKSLVSLVPFLKEKELAITFEQQTNLFDDDIVKLLIQISGAIKSLYEGDKSTSETLISELSRHEAWGIDHISLWELAVQNRRSSSWLENMLDNENPKISELGHWLVWLSTIANKEPAPITLEHILGINNKDEAFTSPIFGYLKQKNIMLQSLSAVDKLITMAYEYAGSSATIIDFYNVIIKLKNNERPIANNSIYKSKESGIELLSVHKSKGLEFDTVFIIDVTDKNWSPNSNKSKRNPPRNLPLQKNGDELDDFTRLMYVAATRAKKNIIISNYRFDMENKEYLKSNLIPDSIEHKIIETIGEDEIKDQLITKLSFPRLKPEDEFEILRPRLEEYQLSATDLITFLNVAEGGPQNFLETRLLKLPTPRNSIFSFGTAMHAAMEAGQNHSRTENPGIEIILNAYEKALKKEPMSSGEYNRYLEHGNNLIMRLFKEFGFKFNDKALAEEKINILTADGVRMTGLVDVLHIEESDIWFDDYKTGGILKSLDYKAKTDADKKWRTRTQIIFYYLLVGNSRIGKNKTIKNANLIYLEAENNDDIKLSYSPTKEEITNVEKLIKIVWDHVQELNFPDTSNYSQDYDGIVSFCKDLIEGKI